MSSSTGRSTRSARSGPNTAASPWATPSSRTTGRGASTARKQRANWASRPARLLETPPRRAGRTRRRQGRRTRGGRRPGPPRSYPRVHRRHGTDRRSRRGQARTPTCSSTTPPSPRTGGTGRRRPPTPRPKQAAEVAQRAGTRRLALTHVSTRYGGDSSPLAHEAADAFEGESFVAQDGQKLEVPYPDEE